jgi:hypothetical protein
MNVIAGEYAPPVPISDEESGLPPKLYECFSFKGQKAGTRNEHYAKYDDIDSDDGMGDLKTLSTNVGFHLIRNSLDRQLGFNGDSFAIRTALLFSGNRLAALCTLHWDLYALKMRYLLAKGYVSING